MILADEPIRTFLNDPWTLGILVVTLTGALMTGGISLGVNMQKIKSVADRQDGLDSALAKIFAELKEMSAKLPHQCQQVQNIIDIGKLVAVHGERIRQVEERIHAYDNSSVIRRQRDETNVHD